MSILATSLIRTLLYSGLGFGLMRTGLLSKKSASVLNRVNYYALIPLVRFLAVASMGNAEDSMAELIFALAFSCGVFLLAWAVFAKSGFSPDKKPVLVVSSFRSTITTYMMAFILPLIPAEMEGGALFLSAIVTSFYNIPSAVVLTYYGKRRRSILWEIAKNPSIIACALGFAARALGLFGGSELLAFRQILQKVSVFAAFIVVGSGLSFDRHNLISKPVAVGLATRMLVVPMLGFAAAVAAGFRGASLLMLVPVFCGPSTTNGHAMVKELGGDEALSSKLVLYSQILSPFAITLWLGAISLVFGL